MLSSLRNPLPPPSDVYAASLLPVGEGYALWYPEPHKSGGEVQLGDVGYIENGAFMRLFNVATDRELRIVGWDDSKTFPNPELVPPEAMLLDTRDQPLAPGPYHSDGVVETSVNVNVTAGGGAHNAGAAAEYTCRLSHGAVLVLRSPAYKQTIRDNYRIREYLCSHHSTWCNYVREHRDGPRFVVAPERIVFVRGWVKTAPTWEATAFCSSNTRVRASLDVDVGEFASAGADYAKSRTVSGLRVSRRGSSESSAADQCVFLSQYRLKSRFVFFQQLKAAAGYHDLPDDDGGRSSDAADGLFTGMDVVIDDDEIADGSSERDSEGNPVNELLDYILEVTDADVAVACEEDVQHILLGHSWPDNFAGFLRDTQPKLDVRNGMGMISLLEKINRECEHRFYKREISEGDRADYPYIDFQGAGMLADGRAVLGSQQTLVDWRHLRFQHKDVENGAISCVSMSPDGKLIATAWDDITVTIWRLADGLTVQSLADQGHADTIWTVCFSPDCEYAVTGGADSVALVWEVRTGDVIHRLVGHTQDVVAVAYSPDGTTIATGSADCSLKLWGAVTGELLHNFTDLGADVTRVLFSPDGTRLAACSDLAVTIWDPRTGAHLAALGRDAHSSALWCVAWAPDGERVVTGSEDCSARVWDTASGETLVQLHEHTGAVYAAAFSPDGAEVATASHDGTVVTCDSWTGERRWEFVGDHDAVVEAVAYAPAHDLIAAGDIEGRVRVWNAKSGAFVADFHGHEERIKNIMFTPDAYNLVSYADDGTVRSWSVIDALRLL